MLVYDESSAKGKFSGTPISLWETPAVMRAWEVHLANFYFLKFLLAKGTTAEKIQASKEMAICERKLKFWERHPEWDKEAAGRVNSRMKRQWG